MRMARRLSRRVPVIDASRLGLPSDLAARGVIETMMGATVEYRAVPSVGSLKATIDRGTPVLLRARVPVDPPRPDGSWPLDGPRQVRSIIILGYSRARRAYRVLETRGVGWGQVGRAWIAADDLKALLARGDAHAPKAA